MACDFALFILGLSFASQTTLMPAWLDLIGNVVPATARGRFFAVGNGVGALLGLGASVVVGYLLETQGFPVCYGLCFLACSVCLFGSFGALALVREPPSMTTP